MTRGRGSPVRSRQLAVASRVGSTRARRSCSTWTACCPTPSGASTTSNGPIRDWEAFFEACGDDQLIDEVARLLEVIGPDHRVVLLTARPDPGAAARPSAGSTATSCAGTC